MYLGKASPEPPGPPETGQLSLSSHITQSVPLYQSTRHALLYLSVFSSVDLSNWRAGTLNFLLNSQCLAQGVVHEEFNKHLWNS